MSDPALAPPAQSAFKDPLFRILWFAALGSGIGGTVQDTAAIWTLTLATDKAWMITLFQSLLSLPLFLLALPAGALADLVDKRRFMAGIQVVGAILAGIVAFCSWVGYLPPGLILASAFILGSVSAFGNPTWSALMPEIIQRPMMASAITLGSVGINLSRAIGPLVGGFLVAGFGPSPAFFVNTVSYIGLAVVLLRWHRPPPAVKPHAETVLSAMAAAVRHVRYTQPIRRVLVRHGLYTFSAFAPVALLPIVVRSLGLEGGTFGLLMGLYGFGGILTALLILPYLRKKFSVDQIVTGAGLLSLTSTALLPLAPNALILGLILFPAGAAWLATMAQLNYAGQALFPHWVRARASAVHLLAVQGSVAIGAILWGELTTRFGITPALWCAASGVGLYLAVTRAWPVDAALHQDLDPAPSGHAHDRLAVTPDPDAGPIRVALRYVINPIDETEFCKAMALLRDVRLRNGAYRWQLWRDLQEPHTFHEVFLVGSWIEHLRQDGRTTVEALKVERSAKAFHQGPEPILIAHSLHIEPGTAGCSFQPTP